MSKKEKTINGVLGLVIFIVLLGGAYFYQTLVVDKPKETEEELTEEESEKEEELTEEESEIEQVDNNYNVNGDIVCVSDGQIKQEVGLTFNNDSLLSMDTYTNYTFVDESLYNDFSVNISERENIFNSIDGVIGTTTTGDYYVIDRYSYDLNIFDYSTIINLPEKELIYNFNSLQRVDVINYFINEQMNCNF